MNDTFHLVVNHLRFTSVVIPSQIFRSSLSAFHGVRGVLVTGQLSCQLLQIIALLHSWYDDSASDSLREFGQILWTITFSYLHDSMMDFCMGATLSTVLDNGTLNRTACDSSLFRRSSARHFSRPIWSSVPTSRSTLPTSLPAVSRVLWLLLWSHSGSATMHVSEGVSHSQRRVRSGLAVGHPQPPWRTRHPCSVDVLPGPTGVTSSPGRDESERLTVCRCQSLSSHWLAASLVQRFCKRCGQGPIGKAPGLARTHGTWCACVHHPAVGMTQGRATQRAFLLPHQEGAGGSHAGSAVRAL